MSLGSIGGFPTPGGAGEQSYWDMTPEQQAMVSAQAMVNAMQSCPGKLVMSGVTGFGLGGVIGIFMASMAYDSSFSSDEARRISSLPFRQQMKVQFTDMGKRSWSSAKSFGKIGGIFSGVECVIESLRAKSDIYNGVWAGALTGGGLALRQGPQAAALGAGGFALFSIAIEAYLNRDHVLPPTTDEYE